MDIWNYGKQTLSQVIRPAVTTKQKIFQQQPQEAGTKRSRAALGNITNQTKNATLLAVPTKQPKSAKKSKIAPSKEQPEETKQSTKPNGKRNSYSSRRKRKSSVSDSVVPHFADMDLSSTPSTTPVLGDSNKRNQSQDLIAMEQMRMETTTIEITEDKMEEEILIDEDEELSDEEEEEERARDRDAKRTDKIQRQRLQQQELAATTSSTIISNPTQSITSPNEMRMAVSMEKEDTDMLPEGAQNIDALDESDPQWVTAYVNEIYENLKVNERKHLARITNYIDTVQKAVTPSMRGVLVDWLVEVAEEYELSSETLYLAVNFLDRFLSIQTVDRRKFQLVGVACMLIASKYEEIYAPAIDEFVYISANTYKREEILLMEILILNTLGFELTAATAKVFLRRFLKAAGADLTLAFLSSYLAELTLQEFTFVKYPPSLIAASAVFLALRTLGREPWTPTLQYYTKYTLENETFQQCIHELYKVHISASENTLKAIYEKYSDTRFRKVAKIPPPIVDPQSEN